jgi:hypothetical protein
MAERTSIPGSAIPESLGLKTYRGELPLGTLTVGVDNIHQDVIISPLFAELTAAYLLGYVRQCSNLAFLSQTERLPVGKKTPKPPEAAVWKRHLSELLHAGIQRAKFEKNIEIDLLLRVGLLKFLAQEIGTQFANLILEGKERIRSRGGHFDQTEQAHVMKSRLAELQADRRRIFCQTGQHVYAAIQEIEEGNLGRARRALFGDEAATAYGVLNNRLVFVEGGKDDLLFLDQYVLLGNYLRDQDRFETIDFLMIDFLRNNLFAGNQEDDLGKARRARQNMLQEAINARQDVARLEEEHAALLKRLERSAGLMGRVGLGSDPADLRGELSKLELALRRARSILESLGPRLDEVNLTADYLEEQHQARLGDYLSDPENARRLFDAAAGSELPRAAASRRAQLLEAWVSLLEQRDLMVHIMASYQIRNIHLDYCPPIHLQQLKKALTSREEYSRVVDILKQFPARQFSVQRIDDLSKKIRRTPREEFIPIALRFAEDFMRLRRDTRNHELLTAGMERVNLVRNERMREMSRMNHSLYEFLLPVEARPVEDRVTSHTIIKADVRGSTKITRDLLARGLNPASLFSLNFYEPVKRILERYGAAKVFIEGDALVLAIFEMESNQSQQRAVSKACALARQILAVSQAYNERSETNDLPRLELGIGIAYQGSAPTYWMDTDSRIMISRALNLSDRLSSCSKAAKRLLSENPSLFRLFLFQTMMDGVAEDEADEFLIRYNLNGVELNDEGFQKLQEEIAMTSIDAECVMPWGREDVTFFIGETPVGEGVEPILIRRGFVRQLLPDGRIGDPGTHPYYEVCTSAKVFDLVEYLTATTSSSSKVG